MKDQIKSYKEKYHQGDLTNARDLLEKSDLKEDKKSSLLWNLEQGTLLFDSGDFDQAIGRFQVCLELIDQLFTKKLSSKAASILINDASDDFYGSSYERSYAYYYLSKSYYSRYLKDKNPKDLQSARAAILSWDSYFAELERSGDKSLYFTDLMLNVFGAQIHEVTEIKNDKQISLQLYKDALKLLTDQGGMFSVFNTSSLDFIKEYKSKGTRPAESFYKKTKDFDELYKYLQYKILSLTKDVRGYDFENEVNRLNASKEIAQKAKKTNTNIVFVIEEGLVPAKIGKPFNIGLRGAMNSVEDSSAKKFIATVGVEALTLFAMNTLGMTPNSPRDVGGFMFAHNVSKVAIAEAGIEFELPSIEEFPGIKKTELFVLDKDGKKILSQEPLVPVSDNGDLAKVVLEEEIVSHYIKTGTRVASKHIVAIVAAMGIYQKLKGNQGGNLLAKTAALATYVGASKGLSLLEKADTRHWASLPRALKMTELDLPIGDYQIGIAYYQGDSRPEKPSKILGSFKVEDQKRSIHNFRLF